jgi:hypothetical protein
MNKEEQKILELNDPNKSFWYCFNNQHIANIKAHQQVIINSNSRVECHWFAKHIKNSDKQLLSDIVLASGDLYYIKLFYHEIDFDKSKYERLMLFI